MADSNPQDYETFVSDQDMEVDEVEPQSASCRPRHCIIEMYDTDSDTSGRHRNRRRRRQRRIRFMTHACTQTDAVLLLGRNVCITGPAVDHCMTNQAEADMHNKIVKSLVRQIEKNQRRIEQLERDIVEKQVDIATYKMQTSTLQTTVTLNEHIIEEFADKIRLTTEELARRRLEDDRPSLTDI